MSQALVAVCGNGPVTVPPMSGQSLDPNDEIMYILHTGQSNLLGTVLATNSQPVFGFLPAMQYGSTYYVSAVVGNSVSNGVDLNDPCLAVAIGTPIVFNALPTASIQGSTSVCQGESAVLSFQLTGNGPFTVSYEVGNQSLILNNIFDGYQLATNPGVGTTTYTLTGVSTANCNNTATGSAVVTVLPSPTTQSTAAICEGESIVLAGAPQTQPGIYVDLFSTSQGCDSTVYTTLIVNPFDSIFVNGTSCVPSQAGVFYNYFTNQFGCDSVVVQTIVFSPSDTTFAYLQSCDPNQTGTTIETFSNQFGCDSVSIVTTSLLPTDTTFIISQTCDPNQAGINTLNLSNQFGCDSVVVIQTNLFPLPSLVANLTSDFNGFAVSCFGANDGSATALVTSGGTAPFFYLWSDGQQSAIASNLSDGNYFVTVTDINGCQASASVEVNSPDELNIYEIAVNGFECNSTADASIEVGANGGAGGYQFSINDGEPQPGGFFSIEHIGAYKLEVQDINGCESSLIVVMEGAVPFSLELGPDLTIALGETVEVEVVVNEIPLADIASLTWSPETGLLSCVGCILQTLQPTETTTYTVEATSKAGCKATSTLTINVEGSSVEESAIYFPTAFSPNDDGINDWFRFYAGPKVAEVELLQVFSRKGDLIFQEKNLPPTYQTGWDGQFNLRVVNSGVYAWHAIVRLTDGSSKELNGDITLMR